MAAADYLLSYGASYRLGMTDTRKWLNKT
jgi:hypothetical protein